MGKENTDTEQRMIRTKSEVFREQIKRCWMNA